MHSDRSRAQSNDMNGWKFSKTATKFPKCQVKGCFHGSELGAEGPPEPPFPGEGVLPPSLGSLKNTLLPQGDIPDPPPLGGSKKEAMASDAALFRRAGGCAVSAPPATTSKTSRGQYRKEGFGFSLSISQIFIVYVIFTKTPRSFVRSCYMPFLGIVPLQVFFPRRKRASGEGWYSIIRTYIIE